MTKSWKKSDWYKKKYPQYLPWHKAMWITKVGDLVMKDGKQYKVINVELSPIRGSFPKITIEPVEDA
jgi:hypothetical protein